jgi:hypothetical protein
MADHTPLIAWSVEEYKHRPKNRNWIIVVGAIFAVAATLAFIFDNNLYGVLLIIGGVLIVLTGLRSPKLIDVQISKNGLVTNDTLYLFQNLDKYWITTISAPDSDPVLLVHSKKPLMPLVSVPISEEVDIEALRTIMSSYLPEEEIRDPFSNQIVDQLGL